jgi:3-isopropylmalate/(R)-2-methylmalate dehydratase small subunit
VDNVLIRRERMAHIIEGKAMKLGDEINTDYIVPAKYLDLYEPEELGQHALEGLGEMYSKMVKNHPVIVAGENFGLGSAREQAPNALKGAGVKAIVTKSFARIFFRNAVNVGIAAITCPDAAGAIEQDDHVEIDIERGIIICAGRSFGFPGFSGLVLELLKHGGMVPLLRRELSNIRV